MLTFISLLITWLIFSGKYDLFHIILGVISSLSLSILYKTILKDESVESININDLKILKVPVFFIQLVWSVITANAHVLYLAFHPNLKKIIKPRLLQIKVDKLDNDFAKYVFAQSITLTPGTVTVLVEDNIFTVHAISEKSAGDLPEPLESQVQSAFCQS